MESSERTVLEDTVIKRLRVKGGLKKMGKVIGIKEKVGNRSNGNGSQVNGIKPKIGVVGEEVEKVEIKPSFQVLIDVVEGDVKMLQLLIGKTGFVPSRALMVEAVQKSLEFYKNFWLNQVFNEKVC